MKKLLLSLLAVMAIGQSLHAIQSDKFNHAFVGLGIYTGCFFAKGIGETLKYDMDYLTPATCLIPVVVAGVTKELYDARHDGHSAELMDAAATIAIPFGIWTIYEW